LFSSPDVPQQQQQQISSTNTNPAPAAIGQNKSFPTSFSHHSGSLGGAGPGG
jgi:hypothetical protein